MISKARALGLALIAVLATAAMSAAAASAEKADFATTNAGEYPAHIVAYNDGTLTFTSSIGTHTCVTVGASQPFDGTAVLEKESSELTFTNIAITNCHVTVLKLPMTIDTNGCDLSLTAGTMTSTTTAEGSQHIECPIGSEITVTVFANKEKHERNEPGCVYHIPPQTPTSGVVKYHNIQTAGNQDAVTVNLEKMVIHSNRTAGTLCPAKEEENQYSLAFVAEATEGKHLRVTGTPGT